MKVSVFDKLNPERLLGTLEVSEDTTLDGTVYKALKQGNNRYASYNGGTSLCNASRIVLFNIDRKLTKNIRQLDPTLREVTTWERTVFTTYATLETLRQLEDFTVAGEPPADREPLHSFY
jgi:hypothetical protein